jgi:16S rRNA (cytidine1402-2'-O)-methyltransferase
MGRRRVANLRTNRVGCENRLFVLVRRLWLWWLLRFPKDVKALIKTGLERGHAFAFVGYVPVASDPRAAHIRSLESDSRRVGQTQLLIETPYRNPALRDALLAHRQPTTDLSISVGLTLAGGFTRSDSVAAWRLRPTPLPADIPAVFAFLARR